MGGQCGENAIVGSWLVFPHQGQCEDGQAVGDDGCTWKVTGFKVVEIQPCFNSTAAVLAAAFEAYQFARTSRVRLMCDALRPWFLSRALVQRRDQPQFLGRSARQPLM